LLSQTLPRRGRFGAAGVADAEQEGAGLVARAGYRHDGIGEGDPAEAIRQFCFDTALAGGMATLTALASVADAGHIFFGTDFPMAPEFEIREYRPVLDRIGEAGLTSTRHFVAAMSGCSAASRRQRAEGKP
jgi:hypothetical protein